jgi:hypothetical protein
MTLAAPAIRELRTRSSEGSCLPDSRKKRWMSTNGSVNSLLSETSDARMVSKKAECDEPGVWVEHGERAHRPDDVRQRFGGQAADKRERPMKQSTASRMSGATVGSSAPRSQISESTPSAKPQMIVREGSMRPLANVTLPCLQSGSRRGIGRRKQSHE